MSVPRPPAGFTEFVVSRSPALLRTAWLLTGDAGRAEDLLQTVLARTWRRWDQVVEGGNPEGYVRKGLYHTYLTWWRRRWRAEVPAATPPESPDRTDFTDEHATRDAVRRALARLPRQRRAIVVLRYVEDRSVADTAALLGCSRETVKVQSARALAALRADPALRLDRTGPSLERKAGS
jgi:RNA polymerase sigma-70 factor (sigma-E family)